MYESVCVCVKCDGYKHKQTHQYSRSIVKHNRFFTALFKIDLAHKMLLYNFTD